MSDELLEAIENYVNAVSELAATVAEFTGRETESVAHHGEQLLKACRWANTNAKD